MNTKERFYAVIGGCVGAVLTLVVCSFSPLGAQNQSRNLFDNFPRESGKLTLVETSPSVSDETLDSAVRRMANAILLDWEDYVDDEISMMIGLCKACVRQLSKFEKDGNTSELLALIKGYEEVRSWHYSRRNLTLMVEDLKK